MKIRRRTLVGMIAAGLLAVPLVPTLKYTAWSLYFGLREKASRLPFDAEAWKRSKSGWGVGRTNYWAYLLPTRLRMADDWIQRRRLDDLTRSEVVARLGEKDTTPYFSDRDLVYFLGPGRYGDAIGDSEWLVVRFGPDQRVSDYRIVHD